MSQTEYEWTDVDEPDVHGGVLGYDETHDLNAAPDEVAATVYVGRNRPSTKGVHGHVRKGAIEATPVYLTAEQAVDAALVLLEAAARQRAHAASRDGIDKPQGPVAHDDHDRRWRLHVAACSIDDFTFWVEKLSEAPHDRYRATEVETGVSGEERDTPLAALRSYFRDER